MTHRWALADFATAFAAVAAGGVVKGAAGDGLKLDRQPWKAQFDEQEKTELTEGTRLAALTLHLRGDVTCHAVSVCSVSSCSHASFGSAAGADDQGRRDHGERPRCAGEMTGEVVEHGLRDRFGDRPRSG